MTESKGPSPEAISNAADILILILERIARDQASEAERETTIQDIERAANNEEGTN